MKLHYRGHVKAFGTDYDVINDNNLYRTKLYTYTNTNKFLKPNIYCRHNVYIWSIKKVVFV